MNNHQQILLSPISGKDWMLRASFVYHGNYDTWLVPSGSTTDFASIPRPLLPIVQRYGTHLKAALVHDHLYRTGAVPRTDADGVFRRILRETGTPRVQRAAMWAAVRLSHPWDLFDSGWKDAATLIFIWLTLIPLVAPLFIINGVAGVIASLINRIGGS